MSIEDKQDFADIILECNGSGGGSTGEWKYFDVSKFGDEVGSVVGAITHLVKDHNGNIFGGGELYNYKDVEFKAVAVNLDMPYITEGRPDIKTARDALYAQNVNIGGLTILEIIIMAGAIEITEEQFYTK